METQAQKKPLNFTVSNIALAKELSSKGLTHKQIARRLNKFFFTSVKHRRLTPKTITNLLQAEKKPYSDSNETHNPVEPVVNNESIVNEVLAMTDEMPSGSVKLSSIVSPEDKDEATEILTSNLSNDFKVKLLTQMLNK